MGKAQPYIGIFCLNPPGALYGSEENRDPLQAHLNSNMNWESPVTSPQFLEGWTTFRDVPFNRSLHMVIDIRTVNFDNIEPQIIPVGWTLLPIFSPDGYILSGIYQVPLFKGPVNQ